MLFQSSSSPSQRHQVNTSYTSPVAWGLHMTNSLQCPEASDAAAKPRSSAGFHHPSTKLAVKGKSPLLCSITLTAELFSGGGQHVWHKYWTKSIPVNTKTGGFEPLLHFTKQTTCWAVTGGLVMFHVPKSINHLGQGTESKGFTLF